MDSSLKLSTVVLSDENRTCEVGEDVIIEINSNLREKNEELKRENYKLKNYIEKTFEVVKNLFSFPIDRFKRIVNNFVQYFEK